MKKAFLVSILTTTRVVVDVDNNGEPDSETLNAMAFEKAIKNAPLDMCMENIYATEEDLESPVDIEDIEFCLFPSLQSLNEEQEAQVNEAWRIQQKEAASRN